MAHLHPSSAIFFVSCTLKAQIDSHELLSNPEFARILMTRLDHYNGKLYDLIAYTISANQLHMMFDTSAQLNQIFDTEKGKKKQVDLQKIIGLIKDGSARYFNQVRGTTGDQVWEEEHYAISIHDEKLFNSKISFIKENPIKTLQLDTFENHPFTYVKQILK